MIKSIQHFIEFGTAKIEENMICYAENPTRIAEMVYGVEAAVTELGRNMISEEWET